MGPDIKAPWVLAMLEKRPHEVRIKGFNCRRSATGNMPP
jgi:hypothetical protein